MITVEELEYCKIKVNYTAEAEILKQKNKEAIKQFRKYPVSGFRPGKAPDDALRIKFAKQIKEQVMREMLQQAHEDVLFETKMRTIGNFEVNSVKLEKNFTCELIYNKKPDFELKDVRSIEVPAPAVTSSKDQIRETYLQQLREQCGDQIPYGENDFVQSGDRVIITYTIEGSEQKEGVIYDVGSNQEKGLDDNIVGMTAGEVRKFSIERGENRLPTEVNLISGMKKSPCPLDDSLAQKLGKKDYDELFNEVNAAAEKQVKIDRDRLVAEQIRKRLIAENDFVIPNWLLINEAKQIAAKEGTNWDELNNEAREVYINRGKDQVKFALIIDSVIEKEPEAQLSDEESVSLIRRRLEGAVQNVDAFLNESYKNGRLAQMFATVKNDYAMQWIVDNCKIIE